MTSRDNLACLADPRWHWLQRTLARVYAELERDDEVLTFGVTLRSGGQVINYSARSGRDEIAKALVPDLPAAVRAVNGATVNITPPDKP